MAVLTNISDNAIKLMNAYDIQVVGKWEHIKVFISVKRKL